MPHALNDNQKKNQLSVCNELQDQTKKYRNYLYEAVRGDENWVYGYDPETKDITEIQAESQAVLDSIKNVSSFQQCCAWYRNPEGGYFGWDNKPTLYCGSVKCCGWHIVSIRSCLMNWMHDKTEQLSYTMKYLKLNSFGTERGGGGKYCIFIYTLTSSKTPPKV